MVHLSKDGGHEWRNISAGLPDNLWVSRVQASAHEKSRVYLALNGYRQDDFNPYLYVSEDYGENWTAIGTDLPLEPVNVIKEDPENPNLLYVGTDHGLYVSLDRGENFMLMDNGLPAVAVHDLVIHPKTHDIVLGTHGRSLYVGRAKELQQLDSTLLAQALHAFEPDPVRYRSSWGRESVWEQEAPSVKLPLYSREKGTAKVQVRTADGLVLRRFETDCVAGLNYFFYDLIINEKILNEYNKFLNEEIGEDEKPIRVKLADDGHAYLYKGSYQISVELNGEMAEWALEVE